MYYVYDIAEVNKLKSHQIKLIVKIDLMQIRRTA